MRMTKVLLAVLCGMLCIGLLSCASSGGGGAASGASAGTSVPLTGEWVTYNDEANGGNSTIVQEDVQKDGMPAYHYTGETTTQYQYGFSGWEIQLDDESLANLKLAKSVSFKVLGDGKRYTAKLMLSGINDHAHFESHFNTVEGEEITIEIPIRNFMQPSWGVQVRFRQENTIAMQWQTHEAWRPDTFDITIWDLRVTQ